MKRIYLILLAVVSFAFTSCLMEEKDLFDKSAPERLDAYLTEYHDLLASSEEGWLLNYFPDEEQSYGGYAYILLFSKGEVTAWFQRADDVATPVTSLYKVTSDDGPVLTFDTYNENLHFFATPDIVNYQALHGDYEFRIVGKSDDGDVINLTGKRTNNVYKLVKFSGDPVEYLNKCNAMEAALAAPKYDLTYNETPALKCSMSNKHFGFSLEKTPATEATPAEVETYNVAYCYTDKGVSFYQPIEVGGVVYDALYWLDGILQSEDGKIRLEKGQLVIDDLIGRYTVSAYSAFDGSPVTTTLVLEVSDNEEKGNVMFTTMFATKCQANVYATFDTAQGTLSVASQQIYAVKSGYYAMFVAASYSGAILSTPVVFTANVGEFGGYDGIVGNLALTSTGQSAGFFDALYDFTATRDE